MFGKTPRINLKARNVGAFHTSRWNQVEIGEIVEIHNAYPGFNRGIFKIEGRYGTMLGVSCGEARLCFIRNAALLLRRNLPEPKRWIVHEIALAEHMVKSCDCEDCRKNLLMLRKKALGLGLLDKEESVA